MRYTIYPVIRDDKTNEIKKISNSTIWKKKWGKILKYLTPCICQNYSAASSVASGSKLMPAGVRDRNLTCL
jgi:hypothetical protein